MQVGREMSSRPDRSPACVDDSSSDSDDESYTSSSNDESDSDTDSSCTSSDSSGSEEKEFSIEETNFDEGQLKFKISARRKSSISQDASSPEAERQQESPFNQSHDNDYHIPDAGAQQVNNKLF